MKVSTAFEERRTSMASRHAADPHLPHLALLHRPRRPIRERRMGSQLKVATYNVRKTYGKLIVAP